MIARVTMVPGLDFWYNGIAKRGASDILAFSESLLDVRLVRVI